MVRSRLRVAVGFFCAFGFSLAASSLLGAQFVPDGSEAGAAAAQPASQPALWLMPWPRSVRHTPGQFVLDAHFSATFSGEHDARIDAALDRMLTRLDHQCGGVRRSQAAASSSSPAPFTVRVAGPGAAVQDVDEDESYRLNVTPASIELSATTDVGAMHGMETLLQLVYAADGSCVVPAVSIDDAPRFRWRGLMIDVSRHFEPIDVIKRTLDGMAVAKLNVFHWHLSDDQGFRAESKKFPLLTAAASGGQFYTQDEMRSIVAYARARGIRVVPEFDIPGHTSSWLLAYPAIGAGEDIRALPTVFGIPQAELDPSNEKTYKFLDTFIEEMAAIFPDAYFHIGGDETEGKGWLENPRIAAFMQKNGFKTPAELQAYFNRRLLPILTKHGKKMMGWDEILNPALPKDIVIQSWRGEASLALGAMQGYVGILSAPYYLDAQKTAAEMFLADPIPADTKLNEEQQKLILGGEVCMWAEQIDAETIDSRVWPRTLAIAERFWSPQSDRNVARMYRRLRVISLELDELGLTHLSGPQRLRRDLWHSTSNEPLSVLASVTEPVSFSDRYQGQHTDALTSLDRLVDAVVPDPPARQLIAADVDMIAADPRGPAAQEAAARLRERFIAWQGAAPALQAAAQRTPRLSDIGPRAQQLSQLATTGLDALAYLEAQTAPDPAWKDRQMALIKEAEKPSALVRFVFLPALEKLVATAAQPSTPSAPMQ